jgi:hypothetical protein
MSICKTLPTHLSDLGLFSHSHLQVRASHAQELLLSVLRGVRHAAFAIRLDRWMEHGPYVCSAVLSEAGLGRYFPQENRGPRTGRRAEPGLPDV